MRFQLASVFVLLALASLCVAWTKEDHEIFRLRDEVLAHEGPNVTFYSFLGVKASDSNDEIQKVYRKRSKQLHPDKAVRDILARRATEKQKKKKSGKPGVNVVKEPSSKERARITKEVTERYARLSTVKNVILGPERQRYDHFLANGFPTWRGTGYYYARFRPGLGSVLIGLLIAVGGGAHYFALYMSWKRHKDFVQRYVSHARRTAWGNESGVPGVPGIDTSTAPVAVPDDDDDSSQEQPVALNRKQKRMQEKDSRKKDRSKPSGRAARRAGISSPVAAEPMDGPQGSRKKIQAENGKMLIVDAVGNVYLEETTEEGEVHEYLLDPEDIAAPTVLDTALFRLPVWMYSQSVGRVLGKGPVNEPLLDGGEELLVGDPDEHSEELLHSATAMNPKAEARRRSKKQRR